MGVPQGFTTDFEGLIEGLEQEPSVSVRVNSRKHVELPSTYDRVPWCKSGVYLNSRQAFTFDPCMHQGLYYVQDASSMIYSHIISLLVADGNPKVYLDACAAPGGKTTTAIDALPDGSLVVANEYIFNRAEILKENIAKWGYPAVIVSRGDTAKFRKIHETFDIVAIDAPCSGEGMFRKDPEAVRQWSPTLVKECAERQKEIVDNLWDTLKPGGHMIYSTCTFNRDENESIVQYILDTYPDAEIVNLDFPSEWNIVAREGCAHFLPGKVRGEGLTVAVIHKTGSTRPTKEKPLKPQKEDNITQECARWLLSKFKIEKNGDDVIAIPEKWVQLTAQLEKKLDVISKGIYLATVKGKSIIPMQPLALSSELNLDAFPVAEINYNQAITYLRREAVTLDADVPKGYVLLTFGGKPLGFIKNLGNRTNNLYPPEWRILSTHLPDTHQSLW